ncbi:response regulator [Shimazuella sp. AN120528]|uniref:response regulator n=1 Tax=Shimazuella soli TaxID=1892854 RepID=UPI001F0D3DD3|nr:response regulator [Shimazuella soli]
MIKVFIIEDDPMVMEINKHYLESVKGFECVGTAANTSEAWTFLEKNRVDLILLDIFMPNENGMQFFTKLRKEEKKIDVIIISAASDIENIKTALRLGAVDYLIKPFQFERFIAALTKYQKEYEFIKTQKKISQEELDEQFLFQKKSPNLKLPKGLTQETLQRVVNQIFEIKEGFSTLELADMLGISRVSIRKYLHFLVEIEFLSFDLNYKTAGRPVHRYYVNKRNISKINPYLQATNK